MLSVVLLAVFFVFAKAMSKTKFGNCLLLTLFMYLGVGMIWNARANQYVLKVGERTTARVIYSTSISSSAGRLINYRYPGAGRGNPLHLINIFFVIESQPSDIGTAIQAFDGGANSWRHPKTVTIAYLPNNPRAHVVLEDCSTDVFYGAALLSFSACVWVVLNLVCLIRAESFTATPLSYPEQDRPNSIRPLPSSM